MNGTRLSVVLAGDMIGCTEMETSGEDERMSRHGGWADIGNLHAAGQYRRRGVATWLLGQAADELALRVRPVLRRDRGGGLLGKPSLNVVCDGELAVDLGARLLWKELAAHWGTYRPVLAAEFRCNHGWHAGDTDRAGPSLLPGVRDPVVRLLPR
jgi:hypothetical protein